jgi:hypothetical protein
MRYSRNLLSISIMALLISGTQTRSSDTGLHGYSYMSIEGDPHFYTASPDTIRLGFMGGDEERRNGAYSTVKILSIFGGSNIVGAKGNTNDFVGVTFGEKILTDDGVDFSQIPTIGQDLDTVSILKKSFRPGDNCVSSSLYSEDGVFLRAVILANRNIEEKQLISCTMDVMAHVFGISTSQSDPTLTFVEKFTTVGRMIEARNECIQVNDRRLECAYAKLKD